MSKKILLLISLALIMAMVFSFSLSGCKEEAPEEEATEDVEELEEEIEEEAEEIAEEVEEEEMEEEITSEPMTIDVWAHAGNPADILRAWGDLYTAEHPNITFNITTHTIDNYRTVAPLAIQSGQEKLDLLDYWAALAPDWEQNGWILDLNQYLDQTIWEDVKDVPKSMFIKDSGACYWLPKAGPFIGLIFYNEDIFDEIGIEVDVNTPASEEELIEICNKVKEAGYEGISIGNVGKSWVSHPAVTFMGRLMDDDQIGKAAFWDLLSKEEQAENAELWKSDAVIGGFEVLYKYAEAGCFIKDANVIDWDPARELFVEGKAAMFMDGTWGINLIRDMADSDFNFNVMYFPPTNGDGSITSSFSAGYAVPSYVADKNPEKIPVIMDFLGKIYEEEYAIASLEVQQNVSPSKNVPEEWLEENLDPVFKKLISDSEVRGTVLYLIQAWGTEFQTKFFDVASAVLGQAMTPEEAANELYELTSSLAQQ